MWKMTYIHFTDRIKRYSFYKWHGKDVAQWHMLAFNHRQWALVYSCQAFADFARDWGFIHQTSSPFHPKSNGHSEVLVGLAKKLLRKAKDSKQDPYLLFLEYRNTPLECGFSPAQLLMSRRTR